MGRVCMCVALFSGPGSSILERGRVCGATGGRREELRDLEPDIYRLVG